MVQIVPQLIDLYKQGKFPVDKLAKIYPPDAIEQALVDLHSGNVRLPHSKANISKETF